LGRRDRAAYQIGSNLPAEHGWKVDRLDHLSLERIHVNLTALGTATLLLELGRLRRFHRFLGR
jgi:hypothetical protein